MVIRKGDKFYYHLSVYKDKKLKVVYVSNDIYDSYYVCMQNATQHAKETKTLWGISKVGE